jgi:hypothetical protein
MSPLDTEELLKQGKLPVFDKLMHCLDKGALAISAGHPLIIILV